MDLRKLDNTLQSGLVTRYHAVPSVRPQTVGQHTWGVAILMHYLSDGRATVHMILEALLHDSAEYFTGDVPFTVKRDNPAIKMAFDTLEEIHRENDLVPNAGYEGLNHEQALLKLCDTLEGFLWCAQYEARLGPVGPRWEEAYYRCKTKFVDILDTAYPGIWGRAEEIFRSFQNINRNTTNSP